MAHERVENGQQEPTVFHESSAHRIRQIRGAALEWLGGAAAAGAAAGIIANAVITSHETNRDNTINTAVQNCGVAMQQAHMPHETTALPKECTLIKNRLLRQHDRLATVTFKDGKSTTIIQHDTITYFWSDEILGQAEVDSAEWNRQQTAARAEAALLGTGIFTVTATLGSLMLYRRHRKRL